MAIHNVSKMTIDTSQLPDGECISNIQQAEKEPFDYGGAAMFVISAIGITLLAVAAVLFKTQR